MKHTLCVAAAVAVAALLVSGSAASAASAVLCENLEQDKTCVEVPLNMTSTQCTMRGQMEAARLVASPNYTGFKLKKLFCDDGRRKEVRT